MIQQYHAQRHIANTPHHTGTIPVGTIIYIQDGARPLSGFRETPVCRNPWKVEAWLNREYSTIPGITMMAGGHLAVVKSLRDGRTQKVADWILLLCVDAGLTKE